MGETVKWILIVVLVVLIARWAASLAGVPVPSFECGQMGGWGPIGCRVVIR